MKHLVKLAVLGTVLTASAQFASASGITDLGSTVSSSLYSNSGTALATTSGSYSSGTGFTATYTENVYSGGTDKLCTGCLNFVITLTNGGPGDVIDELTTGQFGAYTLSFGEFDNGTYNSSSNSAGESAGTAELQIDGLTGLTVGQSIGTFVIFTNATTYTPGNLSFIDSTTLTEPGFIAGGSTPEPSSLLLLGTGLLGTAGILIRKRQTA